MHRVVAPLLVAPLIAAAMVLVPGTAAHAAGSCQGKPATIESAGGTDVVIQGTPGADVILVGPGDATVNALGGDDTVCVASGTVDAGEGNDSVLDTGTRRQDKVLASLGPGDDWFTGSPAHDDWVDIQLDADTDQAVRAGADHIGADVVGTGAPGEPNRDVISGENGAAVSLDLHALPAGSDLTVTGVNHVDIDLDDGAAYVIDGPGSSLTRDGVRAGTFKPAGDPHYLVNAPKTSVTVLGTSARDHVTVLDAGHVTASLGGGDDGFTLDENVTLALGHGPGPFGGSLGSASLDGGPGRDSFTALSVESVKGELGKQVTFADKRGRLDVGMAGLEQLKVMGDRIKLRGTAAAEFFMVSGCRMKISGRGGNDEMWSHVDVDFSPSCHGRHATFLGGSGNDSLRGYANSDVLIGGRGRDVALGGGGKDRCVAERERNCER